MIKGTFKALALAFAFAFAGPVYADTLADASKAVYKLYSDERANCSAVGISPTQLVTAAHCVGTSGELSIRASLVNSNFKETSRVVLFTDTVRTLSDRDVAFIELRGKDAKINYTRLCTEVSFELGSKMYALGYPKTQELTLTEGMYTDTVNLPSLGLTKAFYKTTIPITGGSSGGGLFVQDDQGYCLAGLATAGYRDVSFMNYFSTLDSLKEVTKYLLRTDAGSDLKTIPELMIDPLKIDNR